MLMLTLLFFLVTAHFTNAFNFTFTNPPTQCANVSIQLAGGTAPYHLLLVPIGALHPEVRVISDHTFDSQSTFAFPLQYPANSTFVAVMSDATGFGTGGTTPVTTVATSNDKSCLQKTQVAPEFFIFTDPVVPQECSPMQISYNNHAHPPVDVFVVVPGGTSSRIESGSPPNRTFSWTPALQNGTQMLIVAGDIQGAGKGGSTDVLTVAPGNSTDCLPSPTATATASPVPSATPTSNALPRISLSMLTLVVAFLILIFR